MYICSASGCPDCGGKIHNLTPHIMSKFKFLYAPHENYKDNHPYWFDFSVHVQ